VSAVQAADEHTLLMQLTEQQSVFAVHDDPPVEHIAGFTSQVPAAVHTIEQHMVPSVHP
jgi:hypothetical protein